MALSLILSLPCPSFAQGGGRSYGLNLELGFNGYAVPSRWVPLRISSGIQAEGGTIQIIRADHDSGQEFLESYPYRPEAWLECPIKTGLKGQTITVRLVSNAGLLAESAIDSGAQTFPGHIVLLVGMDSSARLGVSEALQEHEPILALEQALEQLPTHGFCYDAVSALVVHDPASSISPAQREALSAWIAGGGKLIIFGAQNGENAFFSPFQATWKLGDFNSGTTILHHSFGNGFISIIPGTTIQDRERWKEILDLQPYGSSLRLNPGRIFTGADLPHASWIDPLSTDSRFVIGAGAWMVLALFLVLSRRKRIMPIMLFSVAASFLAVSGGRFFLEDNATGADSHSRLFILPEGSGALVQVGISSPQFRIRPELKDVLLPRSIDFSFGRSEQGTLKPDGSASWAQLMERPIFMVSAYRNSSLILEAFLAKGAFALSNAHALASSMGDVQDASYPPEFMAEQRENLVYMGAGLEDSWWEWLENGRRWEKRSSYPAWLGGDAAWLLRLHRESPDSGFLIGREEMPGITFKLQGGARNMSLWTYPVSGTQKDTRP